MSACVFGHSWDYERNRCRNCGMDSAGQMPDMALVRVRCNHETGVLHPKNVVIKLPPPYVTVAECGHCFEDVGERA